MLEQSVLLGDDKQPLKGKPPQNDCMKFSNGIQTILLINLPSNKEIP